MIFSTYIYHKLYGLIKKLKFQIYPRKLFDLVVIHLTQSIKQIKEK